MIEHCHVRHHSSDIFISFSAWCTVQQSVTPACRAVLCHAVLCCADGKKVETIIGAVPKSTMEQAIQKYL